MLSFPLVNGESYNFSSITVNVDGTPFRAIKGVDWRESLKPSKVRGTNPVAVGRTTGQYEAEASIDIWIESIPDFLELLGDGYGRTVFDVDIEFDGGSGDMENVFIPSVRVSEGAASFSNNPDGLSVKVSLDVLLPIKTNGLTMTGSDNVLGAAAGIAKSVVQNAAGKLGV